MYAKLFSHVQVIVARCEYALDPEVGVADADKTGTKTVQLGAIYSYDWLTGAPIWRFPDRTYLPAGTLNPDGTTVTNFYTDPATGTITTYGQALAGLRNARLGGTAAVDPVTKFPVFEVPGIVYADRNGNGKIDDDEVFIGVDGGFYSNNNPAIGIPISTDTTRTGGIFASVTVAPRVMVQGDVQIPTYDTATQPAYYTTSDVPLRSVNGVAPAAYGRYATEPSTDGTKGFNAVPVGMAFVAAGNGVIYGIDAYGNNDTRYEEHHDPISGDPLDTYQLGSYHAGTTNVIWTFSATQHPQTVTQPEETTTIGYYKRLQQEVPATYSFGASAPVLAYQYNDNNLTDGVPATSGSPQYSRVDYTTTAGVQAGAELRLFVGNTNGVVYALDAAGRAGISIINNGGTLTVHPNALPFRKGIQPNTDVALNDAYTAGDMRYDNYRADLKWWFRACGAINYSPSVSVIQQDSGQSAQASATVIPQKGVYLSSEEGRIYCFDWAGPVMRDGASGTAHNDFLNWDGTVTTSRALNDDWYFHTVCAGAWPLFGPDRRERASALDIPEPLSRYRRERDSRPFGRSGESRPEQHDGIGYRALQRCRQFAPE